MQIDFSGIKNNALISEKIIKEADTNNIEIKVEDNKNPYAYIVLLCYCNYLDGKIEILEKQIKELNNGILNKSSK